MSERVPVTPRRRAVLKVGIVVWILVAVVYLAWLSAVHLEGNFACEDPPGSAHYGTAYWSWWPPGTGCRFGGSSSLAGSHTLATTAHETRPPLASAIIATTLAAAGASLVISRRRPSNRGGLRTLVVRNPPRSE